MPGANGFIDPCLPTRADKPPIADGGVHEIKHDGFRLQIQTRKGRVDRYIAFETPDAIKRLTRAWYCSKPAAPAVLSAAPAAQALLAAPQPQPPTAQAQAPVRQTSERPRLTCMSPDDRDSAGRRCGGRAASVRPGGR